MRLQIIQLRNYCTYEMKYLQMYKYIVQIRAENTLNA